MTQRGNRIPPLFVTSNANGLGYNGRHWHIAAHVPSGYGVRAFCGRSWNEGGYRTHGPGVDRVCRTCRRLSNA